MGAHKERKTNYGSLEITEERAVYTDEDGVKWRLYDFAKRSNGKWSRVVQVGSIVATARMYVREGGRERRLVTFSPRDDSLTPRFNYSCLPRAMVRERGRWKRGEREKPSDNSERGAGRRTRAGAG